MSSKAHLSWFRVRAVLCLGWLGVMAVCVSSCIPPDLSYGPGFQDRLGTLEVAGSEVYLDGRPARSGDAVREGARVYTGAESSARIQFVDGGWCQLDEYTDPWFRIARDPITNQKCLYIEIGFGQVYVYKSNVCFDTPDVGGIINSQANFRVTKDGMTFLALFAGQAQIHRPPGVFLQSQEIAGFSRGQVMEGPRRMSENELQEIPSWIHRFRFVAPPAPQPRDGWCCARGQVFRASPQDCEQRHGFFAFDRRAVEQRCQEQQQGWCCKDGKVFQTTRDRCARIEGFFSFNQEKAQERCRPRIE